MEEQRASEETQLEAVSLKNVEKRTGHLGVS